MLTEINPHIRAALEEGLGFPLDSFPRSGIDLRVSHARTDRPGNLLLAHRLPGCDGALATAIPRIAEAVRPLLTEMSSAELFSPLGVAELRRALSEEDGRAILEQPGLDYAIASPEAFRPAAAGHRTVLLTGRDIPSVREEFSLRMGERDADPPEGLAWAFVGCSGNERVSIAVIRWDEGATAHIAIAGTKEPFRGRGYGRAAVSAATEYILAQGRVPIYGTIRSNIAALRMIRPLGYRLAFETIGA